MIRSRGYLVYGLLFAVFLAGQPAAAQSQGSAYADSLEGRAVVKQEELRRHTREMERISDPGRLAIELRRHTELTEDLIAMIVEQRRLLQGTSGVARVSSTRTPMSKGRAPARPMDSRSTTGGHSGHGHSSMGSMGPGMGGSKSAGSQSPDSLSSMGGAGQQPAGSASGGMGMEKEMGAASGTMGMGMEMGMAGGASGGMAMAPDSTRKAAMGGTGMPAGSSMELMMKRIQTHGEYVRTLTDEREMLRELLRHQQMVDEMLSLMVQAPSPGMSDD